MKRNTLRRALPALAILGTALIVSCAERMMVSESNTRTGEISASAKGLVFEEAGVYFPGVSLSEQDQLKMDRILAMYDKSLYRIETYQNGQRIKSVGELPDTLIVEADKVRQNARLRRLNGTAVQVGFLVGTRHATPTPYPSPGAPVGMMHGKALPGGEFEATPKPGFPAPGTRHPQLAFIPETERADAEKLVERLKVILQK